MYDKTIKLLFDCSINYVLDNVDEISLKTIVQLVIAKSIHKGAFTQ